MCAQGTAAQSEQQLETLSAPHDRNPELTFWGSFVLMAGIEHGHTVGEVTRNQDYRVLLKRIPSTSVPLPLTPSS